MVELGLRGRVFTLLFVSEVYEGAVKCASLRGAIGNPLASLKWHIVQRERHR